MSANTIRDALPPLPPPSAPDFDFDGLIAETKDETGAALRPESIAALVALQASDIAKFATVRAALRRVGCPLRLLDPAIKDAAPANAGARGAPIAERLVEIANNGAVLFEDADGVPYADVTVAGHRETWGVRSAGFARWLRGEFFDKTRGAVASEALATALGTIEAAAHAAGIVRDVFVRVARVGGRIYHDLGDSEWRVVEINADGWRLTDDAPVRFRRASGMKALPIPTAGGNLAKLRNFVNVDDVGFTLAVAWLLAALSGAKPFPILAVAGEQGSAKSTFSAMLRALIDPNAAPLRSLPRDARDFFIAASNAWVLGFDNLSGLSAETSDTMCRLASGGGFATRQLRTDGEEVLFSGARPIIANGIGNFVGRADLADRAVFVRLAAIPDDRRRPESEIWPAFDAAAPGILGALYDALALGLRTLPTVRTDHLPRMADFARWSIACEGAFAAPGAFLRAYTANRAEAVADAIEADPVASTVRTMMAERRERTGTATELLAALAEAAGQRLAQSKSWPANGRALSERLTRAAPALRAVGIEVTRPGPTGKDRARLITLANITPAHGGVGPSASSASSAGFKPASNLKGMNGENRWTVPDRPEGGPSASSATPPAGPSATQGGCVRVVRPNALNSRDMNEADEADGGPGAVTEILEPIAPEWSGEALL